MNSAARTKAFSIVEVVIATVLIVVGITALMRGLGGIDRATTALLEKDKVSRLAQQKLDEVVATEEYKTATQGSFDAPDEKYSWTLENVATGVESLVGLRLTVTDSTRANGRTGVAETLKYEPPTTTDAGATP